MCNHDILKEELLKPRGERRVSEMGFRMYLPPQIIEQKKKDFGI